MKIFQWNEEYALNIPTIDEQNQMIFKMLEQLHFAIQSGDGRRKIYDIARELFDYSFYHFSEEEKFLRSFSYRYLKDQKKAHESFLDSLKELQLRIDQQQNSFASIDTSKKLIDWLKKHITEMDQNYRYPDKSVQYG